MRLLIGLELLNSCIYHRACFQYHSYIDWELFGVNFFLNDFTYKIKLIAISKLGKHNRMNLFNPKISDLWHRDVSVRKSAKKVTEVIRSRVQSTLRTPRLGAQGPTQEISSPD